MPRILAALVMLVILIIYYIYTVKTQEKDQEKAVVKEVKPKTVVKKSIKPKPVSQKKKEFYNMMIPPLNEVYAELMQQYWDIKGLLKVNPNSNIIQELKRKYKVENNEELLIALKPHPKSIAIAQGAMESAWGTSRFFKKAYNIFGIWSFNKNDKRIAAGEQRGSQTIWLRKYDSVKEAIQNYYLIMSRSPAFKAFKRLNYEVEHQNPYLLVKKLDRYSEKGAKYGQELASMIDYNHLTQHDAVYYDKPVVSTKKTKPTAVTIQQKKQQEEQKLIEVVDSIQENESSMEDILKQIQKEQ